MAGLPLRECLFLETRNTAVDKPSPESPLRCNLGRLRRGDGKPFPSHPQCLHECGGFRGTRVESRGIDEDVEGCAHQQFDQKARLSVTFEPPRHRCLSTAPPTFARLTTRELRLASHAIRDFSLSIADERCPRAGDLASGVFTPRARPVRGQSRRRAAPG